MAMFRAGGRTFRLKAAVGAASGSAPEQEVTSFGSASAGVELDLNGGMIQMVTLGHAPEVKFINELATDLWLLGDFPMRYRLWAVWQDFDQENDDRVSFQGVTYERLLNRRLVGAGGISYTSTDVGTIVWGAIQHTQAKPGGNLGITAGSITTGVSTSVDWAPGENIGQRISEMLEATGCYWWIDSDLAVHVRQRGSLPMLAEPITLGAQAHSMQRASAGAGFANSVYMSGSSATVPLFATDPNVGSDPRGLWEVAVARPQEDIQAALTTAAGGELALRRQALSHWNVTYVTESWVGPSRIRPGDRAKLKVPPTLAGPITPPSQVDVECQSLTLQFDGDGSLEARAVLNELPS